MIPRGSTLRLVGAAVVLVASFAVVTSANGALAPARRTLTLSLPGPFNGCSTLDQGATPTTDAVLDLIKPSAFLTTSGGNLVGEGGAVTSAELTSLKPETVVYTIAPDLYWSNGATFNGLDLVAWWLRAKQLASVQSDGYRDITSLTESDDGLTVTATFAQPYAEWDLLFRDVEALGTPAGCSWADFLARPTLGPYDVATASANRIVLTSNKSWTLDPNRFSRVVITDSSALPTIPNTYFAAYSLNVTAAEAASVSARPELSSHIGTSSDLAEITFAPDRSLTRRVGLREALSLILDRQSIVNDLFGAVTFSPSVAQSALYSQGQGAYPGGNGSGPSAQSTTTTITATNQSGALNDCSTCAIDILKKFGYTKSSTGWRGPTGAPLALRVAVGPSALDDEVAAQVESQWRTEGIVVSLVDVASDQDAAIDAANNRVDAAIFTRPTTTTASYTARSFVGPPYPDTYPSGVRTADYTSLYDTGIDIFNPVTAEATWLTLDQDVLGSYWVRPLFTEPSFVVWSTNLGPVTGSISVPGLADQVTGWGPVVASNNS
jgi:peptide/nickel transport system substrate-binding protein